MRMAEATATLQQRVAGAQRLLAFDDARRHVADFISVMMPDDEFPDDIKKSTYQRTAHGNLLCTLIEEMEAGTRARTAVSIAPQHGKTLHLSIMGTAWLLGRNPKARIVVATYNEVRAGELGEDFRKVVDSPLYQQVYPGVTLASGSKSKTSMRTTAGGRIVFVGRGGTVTGRTADYFIIDDPMKDDLDIQSPAAREAMWRWFFSVAYSRGSNRTRILVLHTRWHVDDLIGRLCDPTHPERDKRFARIATDWTYLNLPGVITDPKVAALLGLVLKAPDPIKDERVIEAFGTQPMVALWAEDKDLKHFAQWKIGEPRSFEALVMGKPSIEDGEFFNAVGLLEYDIRDLPPVASLKIYGASDHAVSTKQYRDSTVIGCIGIDENDDIWVLPDVCWKQMPTDQTVEELLFQFKTHKPLLWGMESELISKAFGPFLFKRMTAEKIYTPIMQMPTVADKSTKARSIQGRISMGKVHFPRFAPWWQAARSQILQFPYGSHDDFVDWLSTFGLMLMQETGPSTRPANENRPNPRSLQGILSNVYKNAGKPVREKASDSGW
jgi:predicted phage terminase large subunit-like protein